jgi:hypothetical protein
VSRSFVQVFNREAMRLLKRIRDRFRPKQSSADTAGALIAGQIARARQAANVEDYERAWALLEEARASAAQADPLVQFDIVMEQARVRLEQKDYTAAEALLREASALAEAHPGRAPLAYTQILQGQLSEARGDLAAAEAAYENARAMARAIKARALQGRAAALLGALTLRSGNAAFAAHLLREAIPLMESANDEELLAFALGQLGLAMIASGDTASGLGLLNKAIEIGLKHYQIVTLRALNFAAAEQFMAMKSYDKAHASCTNLLKLYPYPERTPLEFLRVHLLAAYTADLIGKEEEGRTLIAAAHTLQASLADKTLLPSLRAVEGLLLSHDQPEAAAAHLEDVLQDDQAVIAPIRQEAWMRLAQVCYRLLRFDEAVHTLTRARSAFVNSPDELHYQMSLAYMRRALPNQRSAAIADYEAAGRLAEQKGLVDWQALASAHISVLEGELGMGVRVLRRVERALLVSISDAAVQGALFYCAARVYYHYSDLESAEGLCRRAAQSSASDAPGRAAQLLAQILLAREQAEAALAALQTAESDAAWTALPSTKAALLWLTSAAYRALNNPMLAVQHAQAAQQHLQPERQPEEAAQAVQSLGLGQIAASDLAAGRKSLRSARAYAQRSDNALLLWEITLQLAEALLPYEAEETAALVNSVRDSIVSAEPRLLLVRLHTVESKLMMHRGDVTAARDHWRRAAHLRQLAQLPPAHALWLDNDDS